MNTPKSVLGVSGACWVGFRYPTQVEALKFAALRALCGVCWVWRRARACVMFFDALKCLTKKLYARDEKPNQPNTLNSDCFICLNLKSFVCVGFVLGSGFFVSGSIFRGKGR